MYKVVIERNKKEELVGVFDTIIEAEERFVEAVSNTISNFDEYTTEDIEIIKNQGYENFGAGKVYIDTISNINYLATTIIESKEVIIKENDNPNLRTLLGDLVIDYGIDGIYWFEEDNTGEIQILTNIYKDILEILPELEDDYKEGLNFAMTCKSLQEKDINIIYYK